MMVSLTIYLYFCVVKLVVSLKWIPVPNVVLVFKMIHIQNMSLTYEEGCFSIVCIT